MQQIEVRDVIEMDDGLGLFGGVDIVTGGKVTFHLRGDVAVRMAAELGSGRTVMMEVPE